MAKLLKGADVAAALNERMSEDVASLRAKGISPTLGILRIGERPDDISYEKGAIKRCEAVGVEVESLVLPENIDQQGLMDAIKFLNSDKNVHGVLMFRPLPKHLDEEAARRALAPGKDVDGITEGSMAGVFTGSGLGYAPCTAQACMEILDHYGIEVQGKRAAVVGRSLVVGRPLAMLLMARNATVTICHTRTEDLAAHTSQADLVFVATGAMESLGSEYFRPGQIVVDVGISWNEEKGKLCGDLRFDEVEPIVEAITPVPGGVGAVTTIVLVNHVVQAAKSRAEEK